MRTGKPLVEWAMMSVCACSPRWKRMAIPRGPDRAGSLSGMVGRPVESENRTVTGVDGRFACGARVSFAASGDGVNVPEHISPLAWAGR